MVVIRSPLSCAQRAHCRARASRPSAWSTRNGLIFSSGLPRQADVDRAVRKRPRQRADQRDRGRGIGRKRARLMVIADGAQHRATATMPGIEHATQGIIAFTEQGVSLVD
jgi:hypothetical protein